MAIVFNPDLTSYSSGSLTGAKRVPGNDKAYDVLRPSDGRIACGERGASAAIVDRAV